MKRATLLELCGAAGLGLGVPARVAAQAQAQPLRVIALPFEVAAAVYYARDMHLFEKAGVDAQITSLAYGGAITAAVVSGSADIGASNSISIEIAHDKGLPVTVVAGAVYEDERTPTNGYLAVAAASPIKAARDLNGKTIAVSGVGQIGDLAVRNWLDLHGGDAKTVKFIEAPFPTMPASLESGKVDAASLDAATFHGAGGALRLVGNTFNSFGPRWLQSVWFTSSEFATKRPELVAKFIGAIRGASAWANAHQADAIELYTRSSKYTLAQLEAAPRPPFVAQAVTPADLQTTIDVAAKYGMLSKSFPAQDIICALNDAR